MGDWSLVTGEMERGDREGCITLLARFLDPNIIAPKRSSPHLYIRHCNMSTFVLKMF